MKSNRQSIRECSCETQNYSFSERKTDVEADTEQKSMMHSSDKYSRLDAKNFKLYNTIQYSELHTQYYIYLMF